MKSNISLDRIVAKYIFPVLDHLTGSVLTSICDDEDIMAIFYESDLKVHRLQVVPVNKNVDFYNEHKITLVTPKNIPLESESLPLVHIHAKTLFRSKDRDVQSLLSEVFRCLKVGGLLYITHDENLHGDPVEFFKLFEEIMSFQKYFDFQHALELSSCAMIYDREEFITVIERLH